MLGYNTAFYDIDNEYWYVDKVNSQAETCYTKFHKMYFEYPRQTLRPNNVSFVLIKDNEVILPIVKVYPTAQVLESIVKHIISLYTRVILKVNSIVKIHPTSNETKKDEFQIKTGPRLESPVLRMGKDVIIDHVDFSSMMKGKGLMKISLECTVNVCL